MEYEASCALPTNFDEKYCYGQGHVAGALIDYKRTGYIATLSHQTRGPEKQVPAGCPLTSMMNIERRIPVVKKCLGAALGNRRYWVNGNAHLRTASHRCGGLAC